MADNNKSNDLKTKLDKLLLAALNTFEELLDERKQLELSLREGFLLISKSRYSMGTNSVGMLQLPKEDGREVKALVKVDHQEIVDDSVMSLYFSETNGTITREHDGQLRKRTGVKDETLEDSSDYELLSLGARFDSKTDPLKWFGLLVPQTLRTSQRIFCKNIASICRIATLQSQLDAIRREVKDATNELNRISMENMKIN